VVLRTASEGRGGRGAWLKPKRRPPRATGRPWRPPSLPSDAVAGLSYVVVEEQVDNIVGLIVAPWPRESAKGTSSFQGTQREAGVNLAELQALLDRERTPPRRRDARRRA
jgi:hypothetical protein